MEFIFSAGIIYFVGHLLTHFFQQSKIPDVLLLIIVGVVIGPISGLMTLDPDGSVGKVFTQFALILILFEGGLDMELSHLIRSARQATALTIAFFIITAAVIALIMHCGFDYSPMAAVITGFICGGTSSAVVIPLLGMINVGKHAATTLVLESALTDVLCIVFTIGQLQSIESGDFEYGKIAGTIISSLVVAALIGIFSGMCWLRMLNWIRSFPNTQYATCFFMFIVFGVAEMLGFSGAVAALAYGIVLGNCASFTRHLHDILGDVPVGVITDAERKLYKELVFLVKIFFFLFLGVSIPLGAVRFMLAALALVLALYVARPVITKFFVRSPLVSPHDKSIISVMLPKGLAAAVLASMPINAGMVEGRDIQAITYYVVLFSIILTSVLIPLIERTRVGRFYSKLF